MTKNISINRLFGAFLLIALSIILANGILYIVYDLLNEITWVRIVSWIVVGFFILIILPQLVNQVLFGKDLVTFKRFARAGLLLVVSTSLMIGSLHILKYILIVNDSEFVLSITLLGLILLPILPWLIWRFFVFVAQMFIWLWKQRSVFIKRASTLRNKLFKNLKNYFKSLEDDSQANHDTRDLDREPNEDTNKSHDATEAEINFRVKARETEEEANTIVEQGDDKKILTHLQYVISKIIHNKTDGVKITGLVDDQNSVRMMLNYIKKNKLNSTIQDENYQKMLRDYLSALTENKIKGWPTLQREIDTLAEKIVGIILQGLEQKLLEFTGVMSDGNLLPAEKSEKAQLFIDQIEEGLLMFLREDDIEKFKKEDGPKDGLQKILKIKLSEKDIERINKILTDYPRGLVGLRPRKMD